MKNTIIAVVGKGGVGKTSIAAAIVRGLVRAHPAARILAIDADPAVGLATALDVTVSHTIDDIRREITEAGEGDKEKKRARELLGEAGFRLIDALVEKEGFAFLAVGRPESAGCFCGVNAYLKEVIEALAEQFDYVVIDGEAGIEQINRRVMEKVTHILLITDPSKKGTQVIQTIKKVADNLISYREIGAIINRFNDETLKAHISTGEIPVLAYIPDDKALALFDVLGRSLMELPNDSELVLGVQKALEGMAIV